MEAYTRVVISLGRECREEDPRVVCAKVGTLIDDNSKSGNVIIYTDGFVKRGDQSGLGYSARRNGCIIKEDGCSYPQTTSSMRMEVEAATAALQWVSTTQHQYIMILTDSQSMLRKIKAGVFRYEWR